MISTYEKLYDFIDEHKFEIKGIYYDKYEKNGGWNGLMDALTEVEHRYNFEYNADDLVDGKFEKIIDELLK